MRKGRSTPLPKNTISLRLRSVSTRIQVVSVAFNASHLCSHSLLLISFSLSLTVSESPVDCMRLSNTRFHRSAGYIPTAQVRLHVKFWTPCWAQHGRRFLLASCAPPRALPRSPSRSKTLRASSRSYSVTPVSAAIGNTRAEHVCLRVELR